MRRATRTPQPSETLATQIADAPDMATSDAVPTDDTAQPAYPAPQASSTTKVIGQLTAVPPRTTTPPTIESAKTPNVSYFPVVAGQPAPTNTPIPQPTVAPQVAPTNPPQPAPTVTNSPPQVNQSQRVNFAEASHQLNAQGQALVYNKIGFHVAVAGNRDGITDWMTELNAAGVPFFLKSADNAGPIFEAQELSKQTGIDNTLVYRRTGNEYDVPIYDLPPEEAAQAHWEKHIAVWPPELDKNYVWLETINEVDKNRSEWLAQFSLATARLALRDGYKWAAFGWSSGEPEPENWDSPVMLEFLRLVAQHPDQLAIALHEYSYIKTNIQDGFPYKLGRFQTLFDICDANGIPRPTVLITEWGWEYQNIPESLNQQLADIQWANELYAPHPQIKGAAIWYLGAGYGSIDTQTQKLIKPLTDYSLNTYFVRQLN